MKQPKNSPRTPAPRAGSPDTTNLPKVLTRHDVARALRCTVSGVRHLERRGVLHPKLDSRGVWRFDHAEVEALGKELRHEGHQTHFGITGDIAATIFRMFRDGLSFPEIVIRSQEMPETVRALYAQYRRPLDPAEEEPRPEPPANFSDYENRLREMDKEIMERRKRMRER
jgi:hypothetical protein